MLLKRVGLSAYSLPYGLMTILLWCYTRIVKGMVSLVWQKADKSISPQPQANKRRPKKKKTNSKGKIITNPIRQATTTKKKI
jgi:hypothetical protein